MMWFRGKPDAALVRSTLGGDVEAFGALAERYLGAVRAYAYTRVGTVADAEDVAQEVFLQAYQGLSALREPQKFGPWLMGIARNCTAKLNERRRREQVVLSKIGAAPATESPVERRELLHLLRRAVDRLDDVTRETVLLHYFAGRSTTEIARAMDTTPAAIRKRLQRARESLSDRLLRDAASEESRRGDATAIIGAIAALPKPLGVTGVPATAAGSFVVAAAAKAFVALVAFLCVLWTGAQLADFRADLPTQVERAEIPVTVAGPEPSNVDEQKPVPQDPSPPPTAPSASNESAELFPWPRLQLDDDVWTGQRVATDTNSGSDDTALPLLAERDAEATAPIGDPLEDIVAAVQHFDGLVTCFEVQYNTRTEPVQTFGGTPDMPRRVATETRGRMIWSSGNYLFTREHNTPSSEHEGQGETAMLVNDTHSMLYGEFWKVDHRERTVLITNTPIAAPGNPYSWGAVMVARDDPGLEAGFVFDKTHWRYAGSRRIDICDCILLEGSIASADDRDNTVVNLCLDPRRGYRAVRYEREESTRNQTTVLVKNYQHPMQLAENVWLPTEIVIERGTRRNSRVINREETTTVLLRFTRINEPMPDTEFVPEVPDGYEIRDQRTTE